MTVQSDNDDLLSVVCVPMVGWTWTFGDSGVPGHIRFTGFVLREGGIWNFPLSRLRLWTTSLPRSYLQGWTPESSVPTSTLGRPQPPSVRPGCGRLFRGVVGCELSKMFPPKGPRAHRFVELELRTDVQDTPSLDDLLLRSHA